MQNPFEEYLPLDPECPDNDTQAFYDDPMTIHYGMGDEMGPLVESHHRKECERCRMYGVENIEIREAW